MIRLGKIVGCRQSNADGEAVVEPEGNERILERRTAEEKLIELAAKYRDIAPAVSPELRAILEKT